MSEQAKVSSETLEKLKKLKKDLSLKSIDAVIQHLLACREGSDKDAAEELDSEEEVQGPEKRRKKNVRDPLFSFKILEDRPEMLEFYTGYDGKRILMITDRLAQVRISLFFFFFSLSFFYSHISHVWDSADTSLCRAK